MPGSSFTFFFGSKDKGGSGVGILWTPCISTTSKISKYCYAIGIPRVKSSSGNLPIKRSNDSEKRIHRVDAFCF